MYEGLWELLNPPPTPPAGVFQTNASGVITRIAAQGKEQEAQEYLDKYDTHKSATLKAHVIIQAKCDDKPANLIDNSLSGGEDWSKLMSEYSDTGFTARYQSLQKMTGTTLDSVNGSLETYVNAIRTASQELNHLNAGLPEWVLVSCLLNNLSGKYNDFVRNMIVSLGQKIPTFNDTVAALYEQDRFSKNQEQTTALLSRNKNQPRKGESSRNSGNHNNNSSNKIKSYNDLPECHQCKKQNDGKWKRHLPENCWTLHPEKRPSAAKSNKGKSKDENDTSSREKDEDYGMVITHHIIPDHDAQHLLKSRDWNIDSGATKHISPFFHDFIEYHEKQSNIVVADGSSIEVLGEGSKRVEFRNPDGTTTWCTIRGILYVPKADCNLLSIYELENKGFNVTFEGHVCTISLKGKIVATARGYKGQYLLGTVQDVCDVIANKAKYNEEAVDLAHRRCGHLGEADLKRLASMSNGLQLTTKPTHKHVCPSCEKAKSKKTISRTMRPLSTTILEEIHMDTGGPVSPPSIEGYRFFVLLTDAATGATWGDGFAHKSDIARWVISWKRQLENQTGHKVKRWRLDNGTEFFKSTDFLMADGCTIEESAPYAPEQNGRAEVQNRTIMAKIRAMRNDSGLPKELWMDLLRTAIYLKNRSPCKTLRLQHMTPFEAISGNVPDLSHLRLIGCLAWVHIPEEVRKASGEKKLGDRAKQCYLVGYEGSNQYRCYDPISRKVIISRDITFDESNLLGTSNATSTELEDNDDVSDGASEECSIHPDITIHPDPHPDSTHLPPKRYRKPTIKAQQNQNNIKSVKTWRSEQAYCRKAVVDPTFITFHDFDPEFDLKTAPAPMLSSKDDIIEPQSFQEAISCPKSGEWWKAMESEISRFQKMKTYDLVDRKQYPQEKVLSGKWVYKIKTNADGSPLYKARWVVRGFMQEEGTNYYKTFSSVVKPMTFKALFAIVAYHDLDCIQMDVKTAFLNATINELILINQPKGFETGNYVCKLNRALYGLKQAPREWYQTIREYLESMGYYHTEADHSVFINQKRRLIISVYVDDLQIIGPRNSPYIAQLKASLSKRFDMTDLGEAKTYLGIQISRDRIKRTMSITQSEYINKVLKRFNMQDCKGAFTPMDAKAEFSKETSNTATKEEIKLYQAMIGSVMYCMVETRPDIAFAVSVLSRYSSNPNMAHFTAVKRLLRYLKRTAEYSITYGIVAPGEELLVYSDASWGGDSETRRSTGAYLSTLYGGAITWASKRQATVALSSCEAEYMAQTQAAKEAVWLTQLLKELDLKYNLPGKPVTIKADNQGAIALSKDPRFHTRTKHIDIQWHFIREQVECGAVVLEFCSTNDMAADGLTKALERVKFERFIAQLGMM